VVEYSADAGVSWTTFVDGTSTATSATVTGLANGTGYVFRVKATNAAGIGVASASSASVTPSTVPAAPGSVVASPGEARVALSWAAGDDGGSAVTDWLVEYSADAGESWTTFVDGTSTAPSATVTELANGTVYTFRVKGVNANGSGAASASSAAVAPRSTPDAPTGLVGLVGDGEVLLGWTVPADDGGDTVVDYVVEYSTGDGTGWVTIVDGVSAATTLGWAGASNGVDYTFRVSAVNAAGAGAASEPSATLTPFGLPDSPASVVASGADASAVVAWSMPDFDGGSPVTGYRVEFSPYPVETWTVAAADTASVDTSLIVEGLTNGSVYLFRVSAINAAGVSDPTISSAQANPSTTASAPTGTAAVATDATVTLSWSPPLTNGGSAVTGYEVAYRDETSSEWTILEVAADATTTVVDGLTNGVGYVLRVRAVTDVGDGDWSATMAATPVTAPSAPPGIAVAAGDTTVTVSWSTPTSDGGSPIVDYQLETSSDAGTTWAAVTDDASAANSAAITGLVNDTAYVFRVRAVSDVGTSNWSPTSATATPVAAAPTPVSVTVGYSDDVWAGILRSLADGETPEAFQARAIATAATLTGRAADAGVLPMLRPAPFTGEAQSVTTVYAGADIDTLNAVTAAVGFSTTETQYAATYLLVFISDIVTWTEGNFADWFDYMATL
jgi:titin